MKVTEENRPEVMSQMRVDILNLLRKKLRPEFLNRVDETILFQPLVPSEVRRIAELQLGQGQATTPWSRFPLSDL